MEPGPTSEPEAIDEESTGPEVVDLIPPVDDLAIPDYDNLSASQVVPRR